MLSSLWKRVTSPIRLLSIVRVITFVCFTLTHCHANEMKFMSSCRNFGDLPRSDRRYNVTYLCYFDPNSPKVITKIDDILPRIKSAETLPLLGMYVGASTEEMEPPQEMIEGFNDRETLLCHVQTKALPKKLIKYVDKPWHKIAEDISSIVADFWTRVLCRSLGLVTNRDLFLQKAGKTQIVGFGFGSYIASYTARKFRMYTGAEINKVFALDPIKVNDVDYKIDPTDAKAVIVLHTGTKGYGVEYKMGTVDFFVNGGERQWGQCNDECSHKMSLEYFSNSFKSYIVGTHCDSYNDLLCGDCKQGPYAAFSPDIDPSIVGTYQAFASCKKPHGIYCNWSFCKVGCEECGSSFCQKCIPRLI